MKSLITGIALLFTMAGYSQTSFVVHFDFNKYNITKAARSELDSFLRLEKENIIRFKINLSGYCDAIGSDKYNNILSKRRVAAVKNYFLRNGIQPGNIGQEIGHGKNQPLNENKTDEERQLNRRVEINFTKTAVTTLSPGTS